MTADPDDDLAPDGPVHDRPSPISLRLVAAVVDYTIVMLLVVLVAAVGRSRDFGDAANWIGLGVVAAYPIIAIAVYGQTVGKRACSLVVRTEDGGRPGWVRSTVRFVVTAVFLVSGTVMSRITGDGHTWLGDVIQVILGGVTYAPILFDDQRRGLHDRLAGTRVVCTAAPLKSIAEQLERAARGVPGGDR